MNKRTNCNCQMINLFVECDCQGGWIRNEGILCHFDRLGDNMMMATKPCGSFFVIADFSNIIGSGLVIRRRTRTATINLFACAFFIQVSIIAIAPKVVGLYSNHFVGLGHTAAGRK